MKKIITLIFVLSTLVTSAQIDLESILEGGTGDAQAYLKGYVQPAAAGFGNGINGGWYTTAKTHKLFGFDIAVIANAALIPTSSETFTFNNADFSPNLQLNSGSSAEVPTLFGSQKLADRPLLDFSDGNGNTISSSSLPGVGIKGATGYNVMPSAMLQVGIGLFKNTDLKIRYIPKQEQKEFELSTFGIGVVHDIKQWIPFVNRLPFDVSVVAAWNDVQSKFFLDADNEPTQALEFNTKTTMFQLIASKKLAIFTLFGGIGSTSYDTDVNMLGTYTTSEGSVFNDPVKLAYSGSSVRANLGLSMKLLFLNVSAEYAKQEFDVFTVTAGFSIR